MNKVDRFKILVRHLVISGLAPSQKGLGEILGYENESYFSQIINNKVPLPKDFIDKLKSLDSRINESWLLEGEGEMLVENSPQINNTGEFTNTGDINNTINMANHKEEDFFLITSKMLKQIDMILDQSNRILTIIEKKL